MPARGLRQPVRQGWFIRHLLLDPIVLEVVGGVVTAGDIEQKDAVFSEMEEYPVLARTHSIDIEATLELFEVEVNEVA